MSQSCMADKALWSEATQESATSQQVDKQVGEDSPVGLRDPGYFLLLLIGYLTLWLQVAFPVIVGPGTTPPLKKAVKPRSQGGHS